MRQIVILISLLVIIAASTWVGTRMDAHIDVGASTLTTTGFILLAAYALGEVFRRLRLPALLGYLAAGMLFGPSLADVALGDATLAPIDQGALQQFGLVNMLAVGVIGTLGGGEIRIDDLKESFRKIAAITVLVFLLVLPIISAVVFALSTFAPQFVPFLADLPQEVRIAAALLFGVLASGMSPSATLALLLEVRAQGRFTSLVLGVVVLADLVLVATFLVVLALAKLSISADGLSAERLMEVLPQIGKEFGWAILLGVFVGVAFIIYLRVVRRELLLFSLGIVFITSFVAARLHAETLLAFLVGGFIVQNFSKQGHELIDAFERIAVPVFVIYFTTQAANLDLRAFTAYLPLTLALVATRLALFYFAVGGAARLARVDDKQRRLLRISFFSQGGVDLVLAGLIAQAIPEWGGEVQTVTVATILVYILIGPPLLARALDQAGESAAARERGAETLEARRIRRDEPAREATFAELRTGSAALDRRLTALRTTIANLHEQLVRGTIIERARRREDNVVQLAAKITATLDPEGLGNGDGGLDKDALRRRLAELHAHVVEASAQWQKPGITPVDSTVFAAFDRLATAEGFGTLYRVAREPGLFEPRGSWWQRIVRLLRRVRRALFGPGSRTVPVGRLWRYHVALEVPVAFWSAIAAEEQANWLSLARHYRLTWRVAEDVLAGRRPSDPHAARSLSGMHASLSNDAIDRNLDEAETPASPIEQLEEAHAAACERETLLVNRLHEGDHALEGQLDAALADPWAAFLASVEVAGTLEHPAWRYRVSARYDAAQAAMADLRERLDRDLRASAAARDTAAALAHASHLAQRARAVGVEAIAGMQAEIEACMPDLERARQACDVVVGEDGPRVEEATKLSGVLAGTAHRLERMARNLEDLDRLAARRSALAPDVAEVPEALDPAALAQIESGERVDKRTRVRLRSWLDHMIAREITVGVLDVRAEAARRLVAVSVSLEHAREVLEYHLGTESEEFDRNLGERLSAFIERAHADLAEAARVARDQLHARVEKAIAAAVPPVVEGRWDEVQRRLRRIDVRAGQRVSLGAWLREGVQSSVARTRLAMRRLRHEVAAVLVERTTPAAAEAYRRLVLGGETKMTEAYQRLFTSVPAESVGLVLERPEAQAVVAGIDRWLGGHGGPILVRGDRGVGKRTLIRQVLGSVGDRLDAHWIALRPELEQEADVARALAEAVGWRRSDRFEGLGKRARGKGGAGTRARKAVVVANVERLFRRTPEGLHRIHRFFDLVAATSDEVLWIVLFAEPAARLLGPVLELDGRFPVTVELPPMSAEQLEQVLTMRHRLSGYDLAFAGHAPSLHEWIRSPGAAWRTRRQPGAAIYERLRLLSGGNVRQALRLWLAAARIDPAHEGRVVIGPLEAMPDELLADLPLVSKVLLAALLLHGPLHRDELEAVATREGHGLDAEITHLVHLGFLRLEPGPRTRVDGEQLVSVRTRLVAPLTQELRACNLL